MKVYSAVNPHWNDNWKQKKLVIFISNALHIGIKNR